MVKSALGNAELLEWSPDVCLNLGRLLAEFGCPRGAAPERVARKAGRGDGRRGALTFRPSRSRVWRPLTGENGVGGKLVRVY